MIILLQTVSNPIMKEEHYYVGNDLIEGILLLEDDNANCGISVYNFMMILKVIVDIKRKLIDMFNDLNKYYENIGMKINKNKAK